MSYTMCEECEYWVSLVETDYGECCRFAPDPRVENETHSGLYQWPRTYPEDGCGEGRAEKVERDENWLRVEE